MDFYITAIMQGLCLSGMALGIFLTMKIFNIPDITTDGSYTLGAAITGVALSHGVPVIGALPIVLAAGALAGFCTGLIHTRLRLNPLLSGILVMTGLYSVNLKIMGRSNIPLIGQDTLFTQPLALGPWWALCMLLVIMAAVIGVIYFLLRTDYGITIRATGMSDKMVRSFGVRTDRVKMAGLAFANALTAGSGFLMAQFQGFSDINMGIGIVIVGLGSVSIAEVFSKRSQVPHLLFSLLMVCSGAIVFQMVLAFALGSGIDPVWLKLTTSLFVLLVVSLPRMGFKKWEDG